MPLSTGEIFKRAAIFIATALVPVLIWMLFGLVMVAVGAVMVAVLLHLGAEPLTRWLRFQRTAALLTSGVVIICIIGAAIYYLTGTLAGQLQDVLLRVQLAVDSISTSLDRSEIGRLLISQLKGESFTVTTIATRIFSVSLTFLTALIISVFGGIYLAAQADLYRDGVIQMLPHRLRANGAETLQDISNALRLWMLGQMIGMVLIGFLTALAASLIGLPSAIGLGLIAGLFEFIPYVGPIAGAIPAVLVATTQGFDTVLWTVFAYTLIQQLEGHLIAPLISREMVYIPPLVLILGVVAITTLFGLYAAIFAAPIAVIVFVAVKKLYIRDSLGDPTPIPGETPHGSAHGRHSGIMEPAGEGFMRRREPGGRPRG